jgi:hypothetical protein
MAGMPDPLTDLPPPSRFDPEDLNSFALGPETVEISPPFIVWAPSTKKLLQSGVLRPSLLLLSQSNVGAHLLHNLPGKRIIGSIIFPDISMVSSCLHLLNYLTGKGPSIQHEMYHFLS